MRIGIVTSGGDAPGMNALLYHLYQKLSNNNELIFYQNGFVGLIENKTKEINFDLLSNSFNNGGSLIGTSRVNINWFRNEIKTYRFEVDLLVLLGGGGSLRYLGREVSEYVPVIGVPCTIDNDVPDTEYTLGFDSVCNFYLQTINYMLRTGIALKNRVFLLETLGGNTGFLAQKVGSAINSKIILTPEEQFNLFEVADILKMNIKEKGFAIGVVSEGVSIENNIEELEKQCENKIRLCKPGHIARGCNASFYDIEISNRLSDYLVKCIESNTFGVYLTVVNNILSSENI
ncbi:hypothetical protein CAI16_18880 [Virgibacillus dokdonensis]|uniref:Phosphofructokinase domain-containing protein n=1 Tax=Virgibacillus dokdonensis TaxID=302167 RepID=A0A3E0WJ68_9BACI|nr:6-phosphofructokinase [Virgibacillus dokdonensis]RFA32191.1 hypothetical protein CAI16_18880 [Virgibacillus dokdonensis]